MSTFTSPGGAGDGVQGSTTSHKMNGVVGTNDATTARNDATPGGNGVFGFTKVPDGAGVYGAHVSTGIGVAGLGLIGVSGGSLNGVGVVGVSAPAGGKGGDGVQGITNSESRNGVYGRNDSTTARGTTAPAGNGVLGFSQVPDGAGVMGVNNAAGSGVSGLGLTGVAGASRDTSTGHGVYGTGGFGVTGVGASIGVWGIAKATGWAGYFSGPVRVEGGCDLQNVQVAGQLTAVSPTGEAVHAETQSTTTAAISALQMNPASDLPGLFAKHAGNRTAGFFQGDVVVTGDITLTNAADCAEDFDVALCCEAEPGMVMVLDDEGRLRPCERAYDKRCVGVVSGAGDFRPGLVLDKQADQTHRSPIALLGKVFCRAEAVTAPIAIGDLLTTSSTPGHAMRAEPGTRAFGSVVGKALRPLTAGHGLIPILISLQ